MASSAKFSERKREEAEMDMTPMLDVTFIMLIFFIVTASFVKESGVTIERPDADTGTKQQRAAILVGIDAGGGIHVNNDQIDIRAVGATIEKMLAENPQGTVVIQADKRAKSGDVIVVMNQIREAGAEGVAIATAVE
ncbi:MAG: biopolymer transporter ExbD [Alphaproteobacteria bacterium]|nr:biopolymer transporter ExbD [Alphaproteobacteria bacterium]